MGNKEGQLILKLHLILKNEHSWKICPTDLKLTSKQQESRQCGIVTITDNRSVKQSRESGINHHIYSKLNFDKGEKIIQGKKELLFQQMLMEHVDIH